MKAKNMSTIFDEANILHKNYRQKICIYKVQHRYELRHVINTYVYSNYVYIAWP